MTFPTKWYNQRALEIHNRKVPGTKKAARGN